MDQTEKTWPQTRASNADELRKYIDGFVRDSGGHKRLAWRGHARPEWKLETTLDRRLQEDAPQESYEEWLAREQAVLESFQSRAQPYASDTEQQDLKFVWTAMAFGRHAGLATRLLDWTSSPWVAAWFACHEHSDADGVMWWFSQPQLEGVVGDHWDEWGVPYRQPGSDERKIEATAFSPKGPAWITKLHYTYPCSRMETQQGFSSVCGLLRKAHNDAIDELPNSDRIKRGRIVIAAGIKGGVLALLRTMNIHAKGLEYPAVDIVARNIRP